MPKKIESKTSANQDASLEKLRKDLQKLLKNQEELTNKSNTDTANIDKIKAEISENEAKLSEAKVWMEKISKGEALSAEEISKASAAGLDLSFAGEKSIPTAPAKPEKKRVSKAESTSRKILKEHKEASLAKKETWDKSLADYETKLKEIEAVLASGKLPTGKKLADYASESKDINSKITAIKAEMEKANKEMLKIEAENAIGLSDKDIDAKVAEVTTKAEAIRAKKEKDRTDDEKEYLKSAEMIEKEAKRRGRSAEDLAQIERLITELKKSPITLSKNEKALIEKKEKNKNREAVIASYEEARKQQDILAAEITALKSELFDADGNRIVKTGKEKTANEKLFASYTNKLSKWENADKELLTLGDQVKEVNKGYVGMDTKIDNVKLRREYKDAYQDAANRERRRKLFEKKTALEAIETDIAQKILDLNKRFKQFVDKDGNLKVELKDVAPEERLKLEEYLIEREAISAERLEAGVKRTSYENEKSNLFAELKQLRERNLSEQLDKSRKDYTSKYAEHFSKMNGVKKWGINVLKRLGITKGEVGLPKELKDLQNKYNGAIDSEIGRNRLMKEGMSEEESRKVIERFRAKFIKFEEVKKEQEIINKMRIDAFASDKDSAMRKFDEALLGKNKKVTYIRLAVTSLAGVLTGGTSYLISKGIGMAAGMGAGRLMNNALDKYWKEEEIRKNSIAALENDLKKNKISPSEFDRRMREIERIKNRTLALKKAIVMGTAFAAGMEAKEGYQELAEKGIVPSFQNTENPDSSSEKTETGDDKSEGGTANPPEDKTDGGQGETTPGTDDNGGTTHENTPAPVEKFTISVEVEKGHGAISMFEDLQDKLGEKYLDANGNLIDPINTPDSVAHILSVTPEELAIEHGFWDLNADAAGGNGNESALIEMHATLSINQDGQLIFENPSSDPIILEDGDASTPIEKFDGKFGDSNGPDTHESDVNTDDREWKILDDKHEDSYENNENTDTRTWTIADHKEVTPDAASNLDNQNAEVNTDNHAKDYPPAESVFGDPVANFIEDHAGDFSLNAEGQEAFNNLVNEKMDLYFGTPDASGIENYENDYPLLTDPKYTAQDILDIMNDPQNAYAFEGSPLFEAIQNNDGILGDITPEDGEDFTHYLLRSFYEDLNYDYKYSLPSSN